MSETIYEGSKSVRAMIEEYTFLTESQMRTLRNGGSVDIVAKVDNIINHTNDEYRHRTALLKVGAAEAASQVDEDSYVNDNGETMIDWSNLIDIGLMSASYVYWKREYASPVDIPVDERVKQGMNVRCVVEMDELDDGTETLNVVSLTRQPASHGMALGSNPASPDNAAPSGQPIDAESLNEVVSDEQMQELEEKTESGQQVEDLTERQLESVLSDDQMEQLR